jgi:hypothetical protein
MKRRTNSHMVSLETKKAEQAATAASTAARRGLIQDRDDLNSVRKVGTIEVDAIDAEWGLLGAGGLPFRQRPGIALV